MRIAHTNDCFLVCEMTSDDATSEIQHCHRDVSKINQVDSIYLGARKVSTTNNESWTLDYR